jgi:hypothetical protein
VDNVINAYDPATHTLDGRGNLNELAPGASSSSQATVPQSPAARSAGSASGNAICAAASPSAGTPLGSLCQQLGSGAGALVPVQPQDLASLPPLPLPPVGPVYGSPGIVRGNGG